MSFAGVLAETVAAIAAAVVAVVDVGVTHFVLVVGC